MQQECPESSTQDETSQVTAAKLRSFAAGASKLSEACFAESPPRQNEGIYISQVAEAFDWAASALEALQAEVARLTAELEEAKMLPPEGQRYSFRWCDGDFDYEVAIDGETGEWGWFVETVADPTDPEDLPRLVAEDTREQQVETMYEAIEAARTAAGEVRDER